jgi:cation:H+ antiporter
VSAVFLLLGLVFLVGGAELLVRGASRLAAAARISPLIVGLTIVAYGTSAPELAVSARASLSGDAGVALGNVVGSNIFNVLFILGIAAMFRPLTISSQLVRIDVPILAGVSLLAWLLGRNGIIGRAEGGVLLCLLAGYTILQVLLARHYAKKESVGEIEPSSAGPDAGLKRFVLHVALVFAGLACLGVGADWFVRGAVTIAQRLGITELLIGLTIVAAGTSLPELAASVWATVRGERDLAVGNVVGSNIFNLLGVLGASALLSTGGIEVSKDALHYDIPVMIATAVACLPIFISGATVTRLEGFLLWFYYALYIAVLMLDAVNSPLERPVSRAIAFIFIPLTATILLSSLVVSENQLKRLLGPFATDLRIFTKETLHQLKRLLIFILGGTLLLLGVVMVFTPGPATVVIPLGLAVLATEFVWAKRLLANTVDHTRSLFSRSRHKKDNR